MSVIEHLSEIFQRRGGEAYLGEPVTMAEHMLQTACLAEQEGADETLIVAALLHDIGHFTSELGSFSMADDFDRLHEEAGAAFLARFFPEAVTDCVRWHVAAKRYLCATEPAYYDQLSVASKHSLQLQSGPMSEHEVELFCGRQNLNAILAVRRWDDAAKVSGKATPGFSYYLPALESVLVRA